MDKNTERLIKIAERRKAISEELKTADATKLEALEIEVKALNDETLQIRTSVVAQMNETGRETRIDNKGPIEPEAEDVFASKEYRKQFRDFLTHKNDAILHRIDATTLTTDLGAVIPTTIQNRVIEEMKDYGDIFSRITITNFKGGVNIPIGGTKPTASWVTEGSVAAKQKKQITTSVTFGYFKLQIRVAASLEASTVSLDIFEKNVAQNIAEALVVKLEEAVINGVGTTEPTGITVDARITNVHEFTASTEATWEGWKEHLFGNIPLAYRKKKNGVILVNPATWDKYMDGMIEAVTKQPIARVTYGIDGAPLMRFFGKEVILTELLPSIDDADPEDIVVIYGDLAEYILNTNLQILTRIYFDEDTDENIQKSTMIADGKVADPFGFVLLKTPAGA